MSRRSYLLLPKTEWDRINRKSHVDGPLVEARDAYFSKLVDMSQTWMKTWPDYAQVHKDKLKQKEEKKREDNLQFIKTFLNRKNNKEETTKAVNKARQMIFDDSCYGKLLTSALVESRILEERNTQIEFQKKIKDETKLREETEQAQLSQSHSTLDKQDEVTRTIKRKFEKDLSEINGLMHTMKLKEKAKQKAEEIENERESAILMQQLIETEDRQEKEYNLKLNRDAKEYEKEQRKFIKRREQREKLDEALAERQRIQLEKRNCRVDSVLKEIHQDMRDSEPAKKHRELIKNLNDDVNSRYEHFVQAGINHLKDRLTNDDLEEVATQKSRREACVMVAQANKQVADANLRWPCHVYKKCICDRQCIISKSVEERKQGLNNKRKQKPKCSCNQFRCPPRSLIDGLKQREKEPSPWSAVPASHAEFARQAASTLRESRHKVFARKVVDEYRKTNLLDEKSLPVDNYY